MFRLNECFVKSTMVQSLIGKPNFKEYIDSAISKINKAISVIKKLRHSLSRKSFITIYKAFLRPLNDYGDILWKTRIMKFAGPNIFQT